MQKITREELAIIIVFVILITIITAFLIYAFNQPETNEEVDKFYIGDMQKCGDFEVVATEYEILHKIYDVNGEYAKGNYLVVYYTIKNVSNKTQNLYKDNFKVENENESIYEPKAIFQKTIDGYYYDNNIKIPSGIAVEVKIYFDIAETEKLKFFFGEWGFFKDEVYIFYNK